MTLQLAKMLAKAQDEVAQFVAEMEERFGYPSEDVRLLAETKQATQQKIVSLGLDPQDTSAEELYHSLRAKFAQDSALIDKAIGISDKMDFGQRLAISEELVKGTFKDQVWRAKTIVIKSLLRAHPPKKTINRLNYRSLDSLLKREDPRQVMLGAQYVESLAWRKTLSRTNLAASDYEQSPVGLAMLTPQLCQESGPANLVMVSKLAGTISVWPDPNLKKTSGLHLVLLLLKGLDGLGVRANLSALAQTSPAFSWWADANYLVSVHDGGRVSFNLHDVAFNHLHGHDHSAATTAHGEKSLWDELAKRYNQFTQEDLPPIESEIVERAKKIAVPSPAQLAQDMVNI